MKNIVAALCLLISMLSFTPAFAEQTLSSDTQQQDVVLVADINSDDAEKLSDLLVGVGMQKANAIVSYRNEHGPFMAVEDLLNVPGIGPATLEKNRAKIVFTDNEG